MSDEFEIVSAIIGFNCLLVALFYSTKFNLLYCDWYLVDHCTTMWNNYLIFSRCLMLMFKINCFIYLERALVVLYHHSKVILWGLLLGFISLKLGGGEASLQELVRNLMSEVILVWSACFKLMMISASFEIYVCIIMFLCLPYSHWNDDIFFPIYCKVFHKVSNGFYQNMDYQLELLL